MTVQRSALLLEVANAMMPRPNESITLFGRPLGRVISFDGTRVTCEQAAFNWTYPILESIVGAVRLSFDAGVWNVQQCPVTREMAMHSSVSAEDRYDYKEGVNPKVHPSQLPTAPTTSNGYVDAHKQALVRERSLRLQNFIGDSFVKKYVTFAARRAIGEQVAPTGLYTGGWGKLALKFTNDILGPSTDFEAEDYYVKARTARLNRTQEPAPAPDIPVINNATDAELRQAALSGTGQVHQGYLNAHFGRHSEQRLRELMAESLRS